MPKHELPKTDAVKFQHEGEPCVRLTQANWDNVIDHLLALHSILVTQQEGDVGNDETEFVKYVKLLRILIDTIDAGYGDVEGGRADVVREEMLDHWNKMTDEQQNYARLVSVALKGAREAEDGKGG